MTIPPKETEDIIAPSFNQKEYDKLYLKWRPIIDFTVSADDVFQNDEVKFRCMEEMERNCLGKTYKFGRWIIPAIRRKYTNNNNCNFLNSCNFWTDFEDTIVLEFKDHKIRISEFTEDLEPFFKSLFDGGQYTANDFPTAGVRYSAKIAINDYEKRVMWYDGFITEIDSPDATFLWLEVESCMHEYGLL